MFFKGQAEPREMMRHWIRQCKCEVCCIHKQPARQSKVGMSCVLSAVTPLLNPCLHAQVMYAYVMRPETLPKSYWKFIVKSGPIETPALEAVRRSVRKLPIDLQAFNAFIKKRGGTAFLTTAFPAQVGTAMPSEHH